MPKLELTSFDLDVIDVSLEKVIIIYTQHDKCFPVGTHFCGNGTYLKILYEIPQVKIMKNELPKITPLITDSFNNLRTSNIEQYREEGKAYDYITSPYFKTTKDNNPHNYSKRKLINILEDININSSEAYNIVKKVNPDNLHKVDEISSKEAESDKEAQVLSKAKVREVVVNDTFEAE